VVQLKQIELLIEQIAQFGDRWQMVEFALFGSVLRDPESLIDKFTLPKQFLKKM